MAANSFFKSKDDSSPENCNVLKIYVTHTSRAQVKFTGTSWSRFLFLIKLSYLHSIFDFIHSDRHSAIAVSRFDKLFLVQLRQITEMQLFLHKRNFFINAIVATETTLLSITGFCTIWLAAFHLNRQKTYPQSFHLFPGADIALMPWN